MAIVEDGAVLESQLWPQGDARDPLGIWSMRHGITGDATGGSIKVRYQVTSPRRAAYVYTCVGLTYAQLTGTPTVSLLKVRLLANWPDADVAAGVQGYGSVIIRSTTGSANFTAPVAGPSTPILEPQQRFILLFDPRPGVDADLDIVELELATNVDGDTYAFEGYGYFWDRSVLQAPGGPRHPGSS